MLNQEVRGYFYLLYDPSLDKTNFQRNKLGITMRPPIHRLKEHQTSYCDYQYYKIAKWDKITPFELETIEADCLIDTQKWRTSDSEHNECRNNVPAETLWHICMVNFGQNWTEVIDYKQENFAYNKRDFTFDPEIVHKRLEMRRSFVSTGGDELDGLEESCEAQIEMSSETQIEMSSETETDMSSPGQTETPENEGSSEAQIETETDPERTITEIIEYIEPSIHNDLIELPSQNHCVMPQNEFIPLEHEQHLRLYQIEVCRKIVEHLKTNNSGLIKMFCGTGKSRIMLEMMNFYKDQGLILAVFPTLALIEQFVRLFEHFNRMPLLSVCSEYYSTTDADQIKAFLNCDEKSRIVVVTYQSLETLVTSLADTLHQKIKYAFFDEAHHCTEDKNLNIIFRQYKDCFEKKIFLTATPVNKRGIYMVQNGNVENDAVLNCGELIFNYGYLNGLLETTDEKNQIAEPAVLQPFVLMCHVTPTSIKGNQRFYQMLINNTIETRNNKILTYHNFVKEGETSVKQFVNQAELRKLLKQADSDYKQLYHYSIDADTPKAKRSLILKHLDECPDNEIVIVSSCKTISEGIDIKSCNACMFVDVKTSPIEIIQIIGRIVRKKQHDRPASVILPVFLDTNLGLEEQFNNQNNYTKQLLDVLASIKEEDDRIYYLYTNRKKLSSFNAKNAMLSQLTIKYMTDYESDFKFSLRTLNQTIAQVSEIQKISTFDEQLAELDEFCKLNGKRPACKSKNIIERRSGVFYNNCNRVYYNCTGRMRIQLNRTKWEQFINKHKSLFLNKDEIWYKTFNQLKDWINQNNKRPAQTSKNSTEKQLGYWIQNQMNNYSKQTQAMKDPNKRQLWLEFIEENKQIFLTKDEIWYQIFDDLKIWMSQNRKRPSHSSKNLIEKQLGNWLAHQIKNYSKQKESMKDPNKRQLWSEFLEQNKHLFLSNDEIWHQTFNELKIWISQNNKRPSGNSKNLIEKQLGNWIQKQMDNYSKQIHSMSNPDKRTLWSNFMEQNKQLFLTKDEIWYKTFNELKIWISQNRKRPGERSKNSIEKHLSKWLSHQITNYSKQKQAMSDPNKRQLFADLLLEHQDLFQLSLETLGLIQNDDEVENEDQDELE